MESDKLLALLAQKTRELHGSLPLEWRYPPKAPRKPLEAKPLKSWPVFKPGMAGPWKKNKANWFYADFSFPKNFCGVGLKGSQALIFVHGWMPFTLWLDGKELFREEHAWMATGPIVDPFPLEIKPGKKHRLVLRVQPTELPNDTVAVNVGIKFRAAVDTAVQTGAAYAQLKYARVLADSHERKELLAKAENLLDAGALRAGRWPKFLASVRRMEETLVPFSDSARRATVHIVGHSHIDMDWMWTWPDTVHCIRRDFRSVADLMDDFPELTFTHSQVPTYEVARTMDPAVFARVRGRVAEGRWENAAGTWVEGDLNMADGESIARHMLYAAAYTRQHLDSKARVLWEPDTFGHPGNMPQLARLGEFDAYFHMRCNPGRYRNWPVRRWEGIDGTAITAFSTVYNASLQPEGTILDNLLSGLQAGFSNILHVWGVGDHGGGMSRFQIGILDSCRDKPVMPAFRFSTIGRLLKAVQEEKTPLPSNRGETYNLFEGCFTTHASVKRSNRACETALLAAETLAVLAGLDRVEALGSAWTTMLFNHFHDIFDGAAVHDTYIDADRRGAKALAAGRKIVSEALKNLSPPVSQGADVVVWNTLGFTRSEPVRVQLPAGTKALKDDGGGLVPVQKSGRDYVFIAENVPAFSSRGYTALSSLPSDARCAGPAVSENGSFNTYMVETCHATVQIDRSSGVVSSYRDREICCEPGMAATDAAPDDLVSYGLPKPISHSGVTRTDLALNVFQIIDEAPNGMAAWHINHHMKESNLLQGADVRLVEKGPVFARFRVKHKFRGSAITEDIVVYDCLRRIDFQADIDWREKGSPEVGVPDLKVSFAAAVSAARFRTEGPYTVTVHPADGVERPTQKFAAVTGDNFGFAVFNDSKYGVDALGPRLRLTLLRNGYSPDPETDNGRHTVRFAFAPHAPGKPNADLVREGMSFNRPLYAVRTKAPADGAPGLVIEGAPSIVCSALRRAENSDHLILRLWETAGSPCSARVRLFSGIAESEEVNFLENPTGQIHELNEGAALLDFRPFEVKTLRLKCRAPA
ncbi:MAG: hypothetical protein JW909_10110 [Planctomycetes bacterium]|nr:hypothetical protein [Planctomycetota bacterium]